MVDPIEADRPLRLTWRSIGLYVLLIGAGIGGFYLFRHFGRDLAAPAPSGGEAFGKGDAKLKFDVLVHVLLALAVVIVTARAAGQPVRQAQPAARHRRGAGRHPARPVAARPHRARASRVSAAGQRRARSCRCSRRSASFSTCSSSGSSWTPGCCASATHATVAVSHASIVLPFVLGCALALLLYPRLSTSDVPFTYFALFCGVAMSITAFPVLARILTDRGIQTSRLGVDGAGLRRGRRRDRVVPARLRRRRRQGPRRRRPAVTLGLTPRLHRRRCSCSCGRSLLRRDRRSTSAAAKSSRNVLTVVLVGLLLSALATECIGIHAVFGAFVLGAIIPHDKHRQGAAAPPGRLRRRAVPARVLRLHRHAHPDRPGQRRRRTG